MQSAVCVSFVIGFVVGLQNVIGSSRLWKPVLICKFRSKLLFAVVLYFLGIDLDLFTILDVLYLIIFCCIISRVRFYYLYILTFQLQAVIVCKYRELVWYV